ncbi:hypothetical protein BD626DRAFT_542938 [Schizophyllum amplum]|uniref:Nephrocystin 3-like N-terminal domain-containing protein n=1 Tax=Schizophyllum amplum TaxID=97359 RepID=A0A550BS22_9AGAR|nr:hypothetical protein BD626DRAFT_542938 [Auriculariopsis ampla]
MTDPAVSNEQEGETHLYTIHHIPGNDCLPEILKEGLSFPGSQRKITFGRAYRQLYATFTVDGVRKDCKLEETVQLDLTRDDLCIAEKEYRLAHFLASGDAVAVSLDFCDQHSDDPPSLTLQVTVDEAPLPPSMAILSAKWKTLEEHVRRVAKIGAVVAEINPISKAVFAFLNLGLDELAKRRQYAEAVISLVEEMSDAIDIVLRLAASKFKNQEVEQQKARDALMLELYSALSFIHSLSAASSVHRLRTAVNSQVEELRKRLRTCVHNIDSGGIHDMQTAIYRVEIKIDQQNALSQLPVAKDVEAGTTKSCIDGTRTELLRAISEWAFLPGQQRGFILYGAAGKGKSAVAHTTAMQLREAGIGAATPFFAFDRNNRDRVAHQLFPTLAFQLARYNQKYCDSLCNRKLHDLSTLDVADQRKTLVNSLRDDCGTTLPIIFIIDALDECPVSSATGKRSILLQELWKCMRDDSLPPNVRFLVTCRYDDTDIRDYLEHHSDAASIRLMSIDDVAGTEEDIRLYVNYQLANRGLAKLVDEVVTAAQTLFECAAVLCRELTRENDPADATPREHLISQVMKAPGKRLYATYRLILQSHFKNPWTRDLYRRVLTWVLLVQSPQPRGVFLDIAKVLLDNSIGSVLNGLSSLLMGTLGDHALVVRPLHTSFRDFVLDTEASEEFAIVLGPDAHQELADACFRIMTDAERGLRFNICQLPTSFALNEDIDDLVQRVNDNISPALQYSCYAAAGHLNSNPCNIDHNIQHRVTLFLRKKFLFWLEACSCMGMRSVPTTEIRQFHEWTIMLRGSHFFVTCPKFRAESDAERGIPATCHLLCVHETSTASSSTFCATYAGLRGDIIECNGNKGRSNENSVVKFAGGWGI